MIRNGQLIDEPGYVTDRITDEALAYLDERAPDALAGRTPFYLHVTYTAPHSPWINNHPQEIVDSYADCRFESCPQEEKHPWAGSLTDNNLGNRAALQGYFAAVTAMDANVGRILDKLESLDLRDDTLVFFTSDNGFSCGHHGFWGKGNGTFPMNMYENSVTVPTLISHPGRIPAGTVSDALLSHYDFFPTVLEYAGVPVPAASALPGRSFAPLVTTKDEGRTTDSSSVLRPSSSAGHDFVVSGEPNQGRHVHDEYGPVRMVRTREWKYVHRYPYGPHELYDLRSDPGERTNLADDPARQRVRAELKGELDAWFVRYADPARDGAREPVTGKGQLDRAGVPGRGATAFAE
jgi:arylsulfatase A-like enzyme